MSKWIPKKNDTNKNNIVLFGGPVEYKIVSYYIQKNTKLKIPEKLMTFFFNNVLKQFLMYIKGKAVSAFYASYAG